MARFLVQVITDEIEIMELLYYDREPFYQEERLHPLDDPLPLADAFVLSGLCASKNEARRLISQGGAYVQGIRAVTDEEFWDRGMMLDRYLLLRKGKRKISLLEVIPVRVQIRGWAPGSAPASAPA